MFLSNTKNVLANLSKPYGLAFADNALYIADANSGNIIKKNVLGSSLQMTTVVSDLRNPTALAIAKDILYVSSYNEANEGIISSLDLSNPEAEMKSVITGLREPQAMAYSGGFLFIADDGLGKILRFDIENGMLSDFVTGLDSIFALTTFKENLYFAEFDGREILRVSIHDKTPTIESVATNLNISPTALTFIDNEIYISDYNKGKILKINTVGVERNVVPFAQGLEQPVSVISNANYLYVADAATGRVSMLDKLHYSEEALALADQNCA